MWWHFILCGKGGAQALSDFVYTHLKRFWKRIRFASFTLANLKPCEFRIYFEKSRNQIKDMRRKTVL